MSEIKYGLISGVDIQCIEATLNYIMSDFPNEYINVTEVGCYGGNTGRGICEYLFSKHRIPVITGIDNNKDGEINTFKYDKLIIGNSNEVYNQIQDESQHLLFIDSCHCFSCVISDFFCYSQKLKKGGYMAFHDIGKHIAKFKDFQHGDKGNPDAYISVRKALDILGLLPKHHPIPLYCGASYQVEWARLGNKWRLIFDEADETNEAGGICIFKKIS